MKIVINNCYGGFNLSHEGMRVYAEKAGLAIGWKGSKDVLLTDVDNLPLQDMGAIPSGYAALCLHYYINDGTEYFSADNILRNDPFLVELVEKDSDVASGVFAKLGVVEIPDSVEWEIVEYDGMEHVAEKHRTWG